MRIEDFLPSSPQMRIEDFLPSAPQMRSKDFLPSSPPNPMAPLDSHCRPRSIHSRHNDLQQLLTKICLHLHYS
ncbi:hypothetical protein ACFX12_033038 [Malus domestica]